MMPSAGSSNLRPTLQAFNILLPRPPGGQVRDAVPDLSFIFLALAADDVNRIERVPHDCGAGSGWLLLRN